MFKNTILATELRHSVLRDLHLSALTDFVFKSCLNSFTYPPKFAHLIYCISVIIKETCQTAKDFLYDRVIQYTILTKKKRPETSRNPASQDTVGRIQRMLHNSYLRSLCTLLLRK